MFIPFTPGDTVGLSVTTTSARVPIPNPGTTRTVMITEALGLQVAFIAVGDDTVVATVAAGLPVKAYAILPGSKEPITVGPNDTHLAAITATGTATLYITSGDGC